VLSKPAKETIPLGGRFVQQLNQIGMMSLVKHYEFAKMFVVLVDLLNESRGTLDGDHIVLGAMDAEHRYLVSGDVTNGSTSEKSSRSSPTRVWMARRKGRLRQDPRSSGPASDTNADTGHTSVWGTRLWRPKSSKAERCAPADWPMIIGLRRQAHSRANSVPNARPLRGLQGARETETQGQACNP
jgi:hypothetical protein